MASITSNGCPYKGLQPYTEEDREYFFGRQRDTEVIASNLFIAPLTILYGTSGVGKSSVLQAGVIPRLRENQRVIVLLFNNWQGENVNAALKQMVLNAICSDTGRSQPEVLSEVNEVIGGKEILGLDRLPLDELITGCATAFRRRILMIFDQFEEYFLYHSATTGPEGFDAEFARAVNHPESGINFMISMREEELSKLDRFRPRIPNLLSNLLRLDNLDGKAADDAIREPLRVYNLRHPAGGMSIENELVGKIIEQVRPDYVKHASAGPLSTGTEPQRAPGASDRIETPFLQLVLMRLWEAEKQKGSNVLCLSTFEDLGGALEIARTHLDKVMAQVSESQRATAAAVLRFLVTPTGSKIALDAESLASFANERPDDVLAVLDLLGSGREMRILRKVTAPGQNDRYELFHDVLGPAILDWRSRYVQAQELIKERIQVEKQFSMERQRRLRQAVAVLAVLLLVMAGTTVYALSKRSEARSQFVEAERQRQEALEQKRIADEALQSAQRAQRDLQIAKLESDRQKDLAVAATVRETAARRIAETEKARANDQARIAEVEKQRANEQAALATNLVRISEFNLNGFDAARLGKTDEAMLNFNEALILSQRQHNSSGEAYALLNIADGYGTKGAVIPLEIFDLIDNYEGSDFTDLLDNNYQVESYLARFEKMTPADKEVLLAYQDKAIETYQTAIKVNQQQKEPDRKKEAWMRQRIGDVQLSSQIVSAILQEGQTKKPDFRAVIMSYNDASNTYKSVDLPVEEGILQMRIAFMERLFKAPNDTSSESFANAVSAYVRALAAFKKAGSKEREADTLVKLGETFKDANNPEQLKVAIGYYSDAAEIFASFNDRKNEGESYTAAAALYAKLSPPDKNQVYENYAKAITAFQTVEMWMASGDKASTPNKERDALHTRVLGLVKQLGKLYADDPKPQADLKKYFEGVIAKYGNDPASKTSMLRTIGDLYSYDLKDKPTAIEYYRAESNAWKAAGDPTKQAKTLVAIGNAYKNLSDRYNAVLSFEEARKIYRELAPGKFDTATRDQIAADLISIAGTYADISENKLALDTYDQALSLFESKPGEQPVLAYRVNDIVQAAGALVTEFDAPDFFKRLTAFYQGRKDVSGEAGAYNLAGDLYAGWGRTTIAIDYYNRGLKLFPTPFVRLPRIGKLYYGLKDAAGAKKFFDTVVESYQNRKDAAGEVNALSNIGAFYRDSGNTAEAISYYTKSVETSCRQRNLYFQSNLLKVLSSIFQSLGDKKEAARLSNLADNPKAVSDCDFQIEKRP